MKRQMKPSGVPTSGRLPGDIRHPTTDIPEVGGRKLEVEKVKSPRIRFKEFGGAWNCFPLADIAQNVTEKNQHLETTEAFTNSAEHGIISQRDFFDFDVAKQLAGYSLVRPDDFVYNPRISNLAPFGPINRNELGRAGAMSPLYFVFRISEIDVDYLKFYFKTSYWHPFMRMNGDSGARSDRFSIRNELFMQMPILAPQRKAEQRRIAELFRNLDETIAATDARLEKLRQSKKSLLEKMFPRPGASVPEIRFKGFEGKWESKKLNEIADPVSEKNVRLETREAFTNSAELGVVSQRDFFDFDVAKRLAGYLLIRPDDFVYNPRISILAPFDPINRNELGRVGAMSPLYFAFRSHGIVIEYLQVFFKTSCWHPFMRFNGDSGARSDRFSIRNDLFMQMPILAPKSKDEQQRIGSFFRELDKLIESVQKKATKLRQVKSALLEEMFV